MSEPTTKLKFGAEVGTGYLSEILIPPRMRAEMEDKEQTLSDLLESIQHEERGSGLIEPLVVERMEEPDEFGHKYRLLCGGRRTTALLMGLVDDEIPLRIYPPLQDRDRERIEIYENVRRKNFSWQESVTAQKRLHDFMVSEYGERTVARATSDDPELVGWSQSNTAAELGVSKASLSRDLALAKAIELVPELAQLKNKDEAQRMMKKIARISDTQQKLAEIETLRERQSEEVWLHQLEQAYIVGDVFEGVAGLPDGILDLIEIDPPYAIVEFAPRFKEEGLHGGSFEDWTAETYVQNLSRLAKECYRLLKEDSWLICWFAQHPHGPATYDAFIEAGFLGMRLPAIWAKQQSIHPTTNLRCYLGRTHEAFYYFRKGQPEVVKPGRPDVFMFDTVAAPDKIHSTEKPLPLYEEMLATFLSPGKTVMTAFAGSGAFLLAAHNQKHTAFGFDKSQTHKDEYLVRLHGKEWLR